MKEKYIQTLFAIPIYLRTEEQYYSDAEKAKEEAIKQAKPFRQHHKVAETFHWPYWEFNDIVGYLQISVDRRGYFRFCVFGIDHEHGYKRIPRYPGERRRNVMWAHDYKNYFDKDTIFDNEDFELKINDSESHIKRTLSNFLFVIKQKIERDNKYIDLDYWLLKIKCMKIKQFIK